MEKNNEMEMSSYWKDHSVYSLVKEKNRDQDNVNFVDGPPFVSSDTLHYGHLAIGYSKDTIRRYLEQHSSNVSNRLGFDCHGVPSETRAIKDLNIDSKDIQEYGIDRFCDFCSDMIDRYSGSWDEVYDLMGRDNDKKNRYFTKDLNFMESELWAFKTLYDKGFVRTGFGVHPYSIGCQTVLSAWEAKESYDNVKDTSLYVKFKVIGTEKDYLVAWTTTPWTLPSHCALCVNAKTVYVKIRDQETEEHYYVAKSNIVNMYGKKLKNVEIVSEILGSELEGLEYEPVFSYLDSLREKGAFRVYCDNYVKTEDSSEESDFEEKRSKSKLVGTGIVHMAPAFGEDDFRVCNGFLADKEIAETCFVDNTGCFTLEKYKGRLVFDCNKDISQEIKSKIFKREEITHRYPFCDRSKTRIIYKVVEVIFIETTKIKDDMIKNNRLTEWHPKSIGEGRFHNWLENTRDWAVSRTRYYGTPIPMWQSEDGSEVLVFGSVEEIEKASGKKITDLHRQHLDDIIIVSESGKELRRVPYVFDCWFDSGCVPFAQYHYPFENRDFVDKKEFMADLILEGIDQTRGWFYSLLVLSTAIFNKPSSRTIVCCGIVLAESGLKMSKRLKNYNDPKDTISSYTSDAIRIYLISSPVLRAESMRFSEKYLKDMRNKLAPLYNSVLLYNSHFKNSKIDLLDSDDYVDVWIRSKMTTLRKEIEKDMESYRLNRAVFNILEFIDNFCNWYIKLNRMRIRDKDMKCVSTFYKTLYDISVLSAPFMPFLSEFIFQKIRTDNDPLSVHLCDYPQNEDYNEYVEKSFEYVQTCIQGVRNLRNRVQLGFTSVKKPIKKVTITTSKEIKNKLDSLKDYISFEVNIIDIELKECDMDSVCKRSIIPDKKNVGLDFKKESGDVCRFIESTIGFGDIYYENTLLKMGHHYNVKFELDTSKIRSKFYEFKDNLLIEADFTEDEETKTAHTTRVVHSVIQKSRGEFGFRTEDSVTAFINAEDDILKYVDKEQLAKMSNTNIMFKNHSESRDYEIFDTKISVFACKN